jgi:hypothetical protein
MFPGHHPGYPHGQHGHPMSPAEEQGSFGSVPPYQQPGREMMMPGQQYPYPQQEGTWAFNNLGPASGPGHSSSSLNSLLNPSSAGGGGYARPSLNTYGTSFPSVPPQGQHSPSSPADSRPNTGYSVSSATSVGYDDKPFAHDYSRPGSSHHAPPRQLSPGPGSRPGSSHNPNFQGGSLRVGRSRRHSQAHSPYPSPYDQVDGRPATSPTSRANGDGAYHINHSHGDFAYSAGGPMSGPDSAMDPYSRSVRPSTAASSMSTASHASSQAVTPPVNGDFGANGAGDADISRCK